MISRKYMAPFQSLKVRAREIAEKLGHQLGPFSHGPRDRNFRTAYCSTCGEWIAVCPGRFKEIYGSASRSKCEPREGH